jgi:hypothetical protein
VLTLVHAIAYGNSAFVAASMLAQSEHRHHWRQQQQQLLVHQAMHSAQQVLSSVFVLSSGAVLTCVHGRESAMLIHLVGAPS